MAGETELDIAKAIRDGKLPSGQQFMNLSLFAMRISGSGAAYRKSEDEYVWRDPKEWTAPEFLDRCNGMPIILDHPVAGLLDVEGKEYSARTVGAIMLPYAKGDEAWGIARIQDGPTAELLRNVQLSTSPGVSATWGTGSDRTNGLTIKLDDGSKLLVEGKPKLVCHLAICERGVWDKNGAPAGIDGGFSMADEKKPDSEEKEEKSPAEKEAPEKDRADAADMKAKMDAMQAKLDAYEAAEKERKDAEEAEAKKKADADADEKKEAEKAKEREDKAKADAEALKAKLDAANARLDAIEALHKPRTDSDEQALASEQARADAVEQAWGRSAPRYHANETARAYITRTLNDHKAHSPHWKDVDLSQLPMAALQVAAAQIRADSVAASRTPNVAGDRLEMRKRTTDTGHTVKEYFGDVHTEMAPFRIPPRFATFAPVNRG